MTLPLPLLLLNLTANGASLSCFEDIKWCSISERRCSSLPSKTAAWACQNYLFYNLIRLQVSRHQSPARGQTLATETLPR